MAYVQKWPCPPPCTPVEQESPPTPPLPQPPVYDPDPPMGGPETVAARLRARRVYVSSVAVPGARRMGIRRA